MPKKAKLTHGFRVNRKAFALTYSCPTFKPDEENKAQEAEHDNPIETHAELLEFPNIDLKAPGKGWQEYCVKDKEFESNFYQTSPWKDALMCSNADEAIDMLWKKRPEDMCKQGDRIAENLRKRMGVTREQKRYDGPFPQEFYPVEWDPDTHALLLVGPPGLGKTQFARYLLGDCEYVKGDLEPLRASRFDKPLLFDEISMLDAHPEQSKEITDVENGGAVKLISGPCAEAAAAVANAAAMAAQAAAAAASAAQHAANAYDVLMGSYACPKCHEMKSAQFDTCACGVGFGK